MVLNSGSILQFEITENLEPIFNIINIIIGIDITDYRDI